jgi:hypothetical protein
MLRQRPLATEDRCGYRTAVGGRGDIDLSQIPGRLGACVPRVLKARGAWLRPYPPPKTSAREFVNDPLANLWEILNS